jgi:hypothetical protein
MSVSSIMYNGTIHELLIPPTIARKTDLESKFVELKQINHVQQLKIEELEQKNNIQQSKIEEYEKIIQQHSAMFELLRQRIEVLEKLNKN